jgi:lysyl-tRNA synthetase class 2
MESYEAYADYNDVMIMVENLFGQIVFNVKGAYEIQYGENKLNFKPPWKRLNLRETLIEKSGIDFNVCSDVETLKNEMSKADIDVRNQLSWAGLMDKLISEKLEPDLIQPTFLIDYPLEMSPLAKPSKDNPNIVERFEGFIAGMEICNAFTELNDPIDQRRRFENQEKMRKEFPEEERDRLDEDFLVALEHGMPPTGGVGIGIDRMVMLVLNQTSIREVISFPQLRTI